MSPSTTPVTHHPSNLSALALAARGEIVVWTLEMMLVSLAIKVIVGYSAL